ncbi:TMEM175 family protein [Microtetraspora malaysiensis]|uniref:TMEM175 family protein n=1 Tax=Microtetraspora malaysiensis TaxID=161358 RepID=A0ABW6SM12_9ACTN
MTSPESRPGLTRERVSAFADAILAIAITLLALELPRPEAEDFRDLGGFLGGHVSAFVAFAVAFLMLWSIWRVHHSLFDQLDRLSPAVLLLHLPMLLLVVLLPYATSIFGEASALAEDAAAGHALAVAMFAGTEAVLLLCQGFMIVLALRQRLHRPDADVDRLATNAWVYLGIGIFWVLTAVMTAWSAELVPFLWLATPLIGVGIARAVRIRRTLAARS